MARKATKPARANGTDLGFVFSSPALDSPSDNSDPADIQARYLAARFGLAADRARLVATLAFSTGSRS